MTLHRKRPLLSSIFQNDLRGRSAAGCLLLVGLLCSSWALGQDSTIQGTVTDPSRAVIPGAEVTVTQEGTGVSRTVLSSDVGFYSIPLLREGNYNVTCRMTGFATQETTLRLEVGQVARVNFSLQVGQVSDVTVVSANAEVIQNKAQDVGQVIEEKVIHELPLNGRNYLDLAKLSTGTVRVAQAGRGGRQNAEGGFMSQGQSAGRSNVVLDGADNSARVEFGAIETQAQAVKPPVEAISEFKVLTNNMSAEYGYNTGAKVLVSTKSGTNDFHGSVYEFHRNAANAANDFFFNKNQDPGNTGIAAPKYIRNQFGATIGGPILKDKTFFFFSYGGTRLRSGLAGATRTVPSQALRNGDFSGEPGGTNRSVNIYDPLTLTNGGESPPNPDAERQPFPNNVIPTNRMDPISAQVLNLYPLPTCRTPGCENEGLNFFASPTAADDANTVDIRVDHNFNDSHRIFGRLSIRDQQGIVPGAFPVPADPGQTSVFDSNNLAFNYGASLSPRTHNEFRLGFTYFPTERGIQTDEDYNAVYGIKGSPNDTFPDARTQGMARFDPIGFSGVGGDGGIDTTQKLYHWADNFMMERGNHSIKLGVEVRRTRISSFNHLRRHGLFRFDGRYTRQFPNQGSSGATTGNSFADFLLGPAFNGVLTVPNGQDLSVPYYGFYAQDDWRVSPRLTVNVGLRWELFEPPRYPGSANQPISRFSYTGDINDEVLDVLDVEFVEWQLPAGDNDCACTRDLNNFGPRVGLAYRITDKTVIRAGAGLYYGENEFLSWDTARYRVGPPKVVSELNDIQGSNEFSTIHVQNGFNPIPPPPPTDIVTAPGTQISLRHAPEFMPNTSSGQWFMDVQHQMPWDVLLTFGYSGSATSNLSWWRLPTAPLEPNSSLPWNHPTRRRWPASEDPSREGNVLLVNLISNVLNANYNAFSFKAEKRYSSGLTFLSSFTWSKNIDYGRSSTNVVSEETAAGATVTQHVRDLWRNRARSILNREFTYNLSFLYELPAGAGRGRLQSGPASWILGGWNLGGILSMLSGPPMDQAITPDLANMLGSYRGVQVGEINLPSSQRTVERWFNTDAIALGPPGVLGTAGRNLIDGHGWNSFDFLLSKNFTMPWEGQNLQFRFEAFNVTNTPHFGPPVLNVSSSIAGQITSSDDPRIIQWALKYTF